MSQLLMQTDVYILAFNRIGCGVLGLIFRNEPQNGIIHFSDA